MEFPDYGLVKLSPRDLTGPGVELYARRISATAATQSFEAILGADQLNTERLYMLSWAMSGIPVAIDSVLGFRWYLSLGNADIQLWGWNGAGYARPAGQRQDTVTPFLVIPGGKQFRFVIDFSVGVIGNAMDGWLWGYSFPKGNVLSF